MKLKLHLIFLFLVFLSINSCCRKPECKCKEEWGESVKDCTPKHYGPYYLGEVKDYLYFKKGSWWVYKNSLSGETDSIYTVYCDTNVINTTGTDYKWLTLTYTSIDIKLKSDKYDVDYYYQMQKKFPDVTDFEFGYNMYRLADRPLESDIPYKNFSYPFNANYSNSFKEYLTNITIQGKTYNDVVVFLVNRDQGVQHPLNYPYELYFQSNSKYYWAKGVGLVMIKCDTYRRDNNQPIENIWELTNYNLIK